MYKVHQMSVAQHYLMHFDLFRKNSKNHQSIGFYNLAAILDAMLELTVDNFKITYYI